MRRLASVVILLGVAGARAEGQSFDASVARLLPPDASFLLGIEWRRALAQPTGSLLEKQIAGAGVTLPGLMSFAQMLREDVDSVTIAMSAAAVPKLGGESPSLIVVKGRFDPARLRGFMSGRREMYRQVAVVAPAKSKPPSTRIALLDATTMLSGDRREVLAAIDRSAGVGPRRPAGALAERAAALASRYDIWVALNAPPGGFPGGAGPSQVLADLNGLEMGLSFSSGLALEANLRARGAESIPALAATIRGLLAMAAMSQPATPESAEWLRKIEVSEQAQGVRVSLSLSEAEVTRAVAGMQAPQQRRAAAARAAPPAPREPAARRSIRIVGQESGPVEVPAPRNPN